VPATLSGLLKGTNSGKAPVASRVAPDRGPVLQPMPGGVDGPREQEGVFP